MAAFSVAVGAEPRGWVRARMSAMLGRDFIFWMIWVVVVDQESGDWGCGEMAKRVTGPISPMGQWFWMMSAPWRAG